MIKLLAFSIQMLRRDLQAGELRIIFVALVIAVASMTSVNYFVDRIDKSLRQHANELLAADLLIKSDHKIPQSYRNLANQLHLQSVETYSFRSMVLFGDVSQLAEVKAVAQGYPLRGQLRTSDKLFAQDNATVTIPAPGTVWLDPELMMRLKIDTGQRITLGAKSFVVNSILAYEPDRGSGMFNIAPRLLLNNEDLAATRLLQEGSRARYQLLVAGESEPVKKFQAGAKKLLQRGEQIVDVTDARQEVREALNRAQRFLVLSALVSVILAAVAISMAIRSYVQRHLDNCAIMRCLGATQAFVFNVYVLEMICLGMVAGFVGCVCGFAGHAVLVEIFSQLLVTQLPAASWFPFLFGLVSGIVLLLVFAIPPLLQLKNVPTMRVIRRELGMIKPTTFSASIVGIILMAALLIWQAGEVKLGLTMLAGLMATVLALFLVSWLLLLSLRHLRSNVGISWRFGIANISRRANKSMAQMVAFGIGIMALLLLSFVTNDLLTTWNSRLPADTPNRFIVNIQEDQLDKIQQLFADENLPAPALFPMVRGRLVKINNESVTADDYENPRARHLVEREFNLSWAGQLQEDNKIIAGQWWSKKDDYKDLISIEADLAKTLGISLGDKLTFSLAGEIFDMQVASIRQVEWDSFRVNFYAITSPGLLKDYPASYITSFYLPKGRQSTLNTLVQQFPNLTVVDISSIMDKVRNIILRVTEAVRYVFLFTLLAGLAVLYAAIQSTHDERIRESAVLKTLGASNKQLIRGLMSEFVTLGVLSGVVAALSATAVAYMLAAYVMNMSYVFNIWIWMIGPLGGGLGVGLAGYLGVRSLLKQAPVSILRSTNL